MNYLITGISKGLGLEVVKNLLKSQEGIIIYGVCRTISNELDSVNREYPDRLKILKYDLCNVDNIHKELFKGFISNKLRIDGFINNAAIAYDDIITNLRLEPLENMFRVNVFAPMLITKYCIRNMLLHKIKGSIVHVSSISVHTGYKGLSMYAATKGALEAFSKNTAREWGSFGIRSNSLVAGFMETSMSSALTTEQKDRIYKRTSLKSPTDVNTVASTISFLLSENSKSITGQNIFVDSGTI
jgi:3-oxoacyl-[acyl-carrier protein] reductase